MPSIHCKYLVSISPVTYDFCLYLFCSAVVLDPLYLSHPCLGNGSGFFPGLSFWRQTLVLCSFILLFTPSNNHTYLDSESVSWFVNCARECIGRVSCGYVCLYQGKAPSMDYKLYLLNSRCWAAALRMDRVGVSSSLGHTHKYRFMAC